MNGGAEAKRETQVIAQVRELNSSLDRLATGVDKLQDRIGKVLRDSTPEVASGKEDEEMLVSLAQTIRISYRAANRIGDQVEDIINRLEL